jgi:hypothetical protein
MGTLNGNEAMRMRVALHEAAYVYVCDTNIDPQAEGLVIVWDGNIQGRMRVYRADTWEMVECWQGGRTGGAIRDRWEARERVQEWLEMYGK